MVDMGDLQEASEWYTKLASTNAAKEWTLLASNYLSLGQFELARATLRLLHDSQSDQALRYLSRLAIQNIPSAWFVHAVLLFRSGNFDACKALSTLLRKTRRPFGTFVASCRSDPDVLLCTGL